MAFFSTKSALKISLFVDKFSTNANAIPKNATALKTQNMTFSGDFIKDGFGL
ncbi:hypothetical protein [Helicobacter sp. 23-1045]